MKIIEKTFNALTNEETITERNETKAEESERLAAATKKIEEDVAKAALEAKKQEVLEKLGLTAEEVAALLA